MSSENQFNLALDDLRIMKDMCSDYEATLRKIATTDWRGNKPVEITDAEAALARWLV